MPGAWHRAFPGTEHFCAEMIDNNRKSQLAGKIGCLPEEITLSDSRGGLTSSKGWLLEQPSWKANCRGKQYVCSSVFKGEHAGTEVNCAVV